MLQQTCQVETLDRQLAQIAEFKGFMGMMKKEGKKMAEERQRETIEMSAKEYELRKMIASREAEIDQLRAVVCSRGLQIDDLCSLLDAQREMLKVRDKELAQAKNAWNIPIPQH
jgi:inorganic pyrophosphatase/exopolyphosphatase